MPLDLTALEKQKELIDQILKLASNPDAAAMLEKLVVEQRNELVHARRPFAPLLQPEQNEFRMFRSDDAEGEEERGAQIKAIRESISRFPGPFSVADIGDDLRSRGLKYDNIAIGRALQRLGKRYHELVLVSKGKGNTPNMWARTEKFRLQ